MSLLPKGESDSVKKIRQDWYDKYMKLTRGIDKIMADSEKHPLSDETINQLVKLLNDK